MKSEVTACLPTPVNNHADAGKRLDVLSRTCLALATAIEGLGRMKDPPQAELKELIAALLLATKQTTWLAKSSDPEYTYRGKEGGR